MVELTHMIAIHSKQRKNSDQIQTGQNAKSLGAFYTDAQVANFLTWWAIRSEQYLVMDPSFGGGVFLHSAGQRLLELRGQPAVRLFGMEVDPIAYTRTVSKLSERFGVEQQNLLRCDFFDIDPEDIPPMDVVIGNPPFIRYQRFAGDARKQALMRAEQQGVRLSKLSSSWAPFLIHSIAMLKSGGRLAMIVPMEIAHAAYAKPVIKYLSETFRKIVFLTFQKKLFPDLSEDTLLLLAEDKGSSPSGFLVRDLAHAGLLVEIQGQDRLPLPGIRRINTQAVSQGDERLIEYLIPKKARELYRELTSLPVVHQLGELADVGIGYVTGANDFFHLHPREAQRWRIPKTFLRRAVRRGRALSGLRFKHQDWIDALEAGDSGYLLYIEPGKELTRSVQHYLKQGEAQGVSNAYKCRTRSPWFCVPHVHHPDAFLSYMSGITPRLVANEAGAVAPNSLHILRLHPEVTLTSGLLATLWQTSLTRLSVEIEGHALGGGMLKLEPTEAENIMVARTPKRDAILTALAEELDELLRKGDGSTAQARADKVILKDGIGLTQNECLLLRTAAEALRNRRYARSSKT